MIIPLPQPAQSDLVATLRRGGAAAGSTIVYCPSRSCVEEVRALLVAEGVHAAAYHAGLTHAERHDVHPHGQSGLLLAGAMPGHHGAGP